MHPAQQHRGRSDQGQKPQQVTYPIARGAVFGVLKRLWDFGRVRYSGVTKNATRAFAVLALDNIYLSRQPLMAQVRP